MLWCTPGYTARWNWEAIYLTPTRFSAVDQTGFWWSDDFVTDRRLILIRVRLVIRLVVYRRMRNLSGRTCDRVSNIIRSRQVITRDATALSTGNRQLTMTFRTYECTTCITNHMHIDWSLITNHMHIDRSLNSQKPDGLYVSNTFSISSRYAEQ